MTTLRAKHETVTPCLRRIPLSQEKDPALPRRPLPGEWPESFSAAHCSQRSSSVRGCLPVTPRRRSSDASPAQCSPP